MRTGLPIRPLAAKVFLIALLSIPLLAPFAAPVSAATSANGGAGPAASANLVVGSSVYLPLLTR